MAHSIRVAPGVAAKVTISASRELFSYLPPMTCLVSGNLALKGFIILTSFQSFQNDD